MLPSFTRILGTAAVTCVMASCCAASEMSSPVWAVFDSFGDTPERRLERMLFLNDYCHPDDRIKIDESVLRRVQNVVHKFEDPPGFRPVGGMAYCVNPSGDIVSFRFRTVNDRSAFEKFVDENVTRRGANTDVRWDWDRDKATLSSSSESVEEKSGVLVRRRFLDAHFAYVPGLVAWTSGDAVFSKDSLRVLQRLAGNVAKHDWVLYASPSNVADTHRENFVKLIESNLGHLMQQKDGESDEAYVARRRFADQYITILHSVFTDVEEVLITIDEAQANRDFLCRSSLRLRPASKTADFMKRLIPVRSTERVRDITEHVMCDVNVAMPEEARQFLDSLSAAGLPWWREWGVGPIASQSTGSVAGHISLNMDTPLFPDIVAMARTDHSLAAFWALIDPSMPAGDGERKVTLEGASQLLGMKLPEIMVAASKNGDHLFVQARSVTSPAADISDTVPVDSQSGQLCRVELDLRPITAINPSNGAKLLLEIVERAYHSYLINEKNALVRRSSGINEVSFVSVLPLIRPNHELSLRLNVRASTDGEQLTAECRISKDP